MHWKPHNRSRSVIIESFAVFGLITAILVGLTLWRPPAAIAGMVCVYGLDQWLQSQGGVFAQASHLTNMAMAGVVVVGITVALFRNGLRLGDYPSVGYFTWVLLGLAAVSFFWSPDPSIFQSRWAKNGPYLLTVVGLMPLLVRDWTDARMMLHAVLLIGTPILVLLAFSVEWVSRGVVVDGKETGNPLAVATLAAHVALAALLLNFHGIARFWQLARWFIVLLGLYIAMRSGSRGQTLGMVLAAVTFLPVSRGIRSGKGFAATTFAVLVGGGIMLWAQMHWATSSRWEWQTLAATYSGSRLDPALRVLGAWADSGPLHWLVGMGSTASFTIIGFYPHLVIAEVLAEEGLIGLGLFLIIIFLTCRNLIRCCGATQTHAAARGTVAVVGAILMLEFLVSFKQGSLIASTFMLAFAIILGRITAGMRVCPVPLNSAIPHNSRPAFRLSAFQHA